MSEEVRKVGVIVKFIANRGYGFIEDDLEKRQYFFHFTELPPETVPEEGDRFSFISGKSKYGKIQAKNLQPIN